MMLASPFKMAYSDRKSGIKILPRLSSSTSAAPAKNNLTKSRVSFCPVGSSESLFATFSHSVSGYTKRQESKPPVIIARFPRSFRNLAGTAKRLFESKLCKYSPINIDLGQIAFIFKGEIRYAHYPQVYPLSPTSLSLYPTHTTLSNIYKHYHGEKKPRTFQKKVRDWVNKIL